MISEMQERIWTSFVAENMIINLSPLFKRLENRVYLGPGLLKNSILNCFRCPILYGDKRICSKHSFKNDF